LTFGGKDHYPKALVRVHFSAARVSMRWLQIHGFRVWIV
jgi:hypothetical protein